MKIVFLWTDVLLWLFVILTIILIFNLNKRTDYRQIFYNLVQSKTAVISLVILAIYLSIALLDSIHFRNHIDHGSDKYYGEVESVLDHVLLPWSAVSEVTFAAPFSKYSYVKENINNTNNIDGDAEINLVRDYPLLIELDKIKQDDINIIILKIISGIFIFSLIFYGLKYFLYNKFNLYLSSNKLYRYLFFSIYISCILIFILFYLYKQHHVFGTDKIGHDIFYISIKSIRTGITIGLLTTLFMLPFAISLGTIAGYYGGLIDDIIQYIYITLSSIPGILLIAAFILIIQTQIALHPNLFDTVEQKADLRLLCLCFILGITSWSGLCRLIRAETLKIKSLDYVQAAKSMRVRDYLIILRHIVPNLIHIIIINVSISFSGLVLAEAVLSYIGVGVDPSTFSWGNMINSARTELARIPVVWWPIVSAFSFMSFFVLALNLFANKLQDAFDPRIRLQD